MATTLGNGYKLPATADTGSTVWTAVERDISLANAHTHNGADGEPLVKSDSLPSGGGSRNTGWASFDSATGLYSQTVTMPTAVNSIDGTITYAMKFDECMISFRDTSTGEPCFPKMVKATASTYTLYSSDSSLALTAVYV